LSAKKERQRVPEKNAPPIEPKYRTENQTLEHHGEEREGKEYKIRGEGIPHNG